MKRLLKPFLLSVYRIFGLPYAVRFLCLKIFRTDRRKVVFSSFWGRGFADNPKYVALELLKRRPDLDLVWLSKNPGSIARQLPKGMRTGRYKGWGGICESATAAVRVDNQLINLHTLGYAKRADQLYVQTWHGSLGIKRIGFDFAEGTSDHDRRLWNRRIDGEMVDILVSNSSFESVIYREQWLGGGKICEFGHPRNDILVNGVSDDFARDIRMRCGFAKDEKILLYAPTFRDDDPEFDYSFDYDAVLNAVRLRFGGRWRMAVRKHPRMSSAMLGVGSRADIADVSGYPDMQELLTVVDALITDYSSCMFDFMLTGRPVFVYAKDLGKYEKSRGFYYPFSETPFSVAQDAGGVVQNVAMFDEAKYRAETKDFLKRRGCVEDGRAAERVADAILEFIDGGTGEGYGRGR